MANPDFSIIITSYNVKDYIDRAIQSALSQESVLLEIICVDDASTDGTWEILQSYKDERIRTFRLNDNSGPSVARNYAIAHATGKYIAVLDGDDILLPGRMKRILETTRSQECDICIDNLTVFNEADNAKKPMFDPARLKRLNPLSLTEFILGNQLFKNGYTLGYTKPVLNREFLKSNELHYDPEIRIGEDYCLLAAALAKGAHCIILAEEGYQYTVRKGSISHRLTLQDVTRMQELDAKLWAQHTLSSTAQSAQQQRSNGLKRAAYFLQLVDAIKTKDYVNACYIALRHPSCIWLLHMPISVRIKRLFSSSHAS